MHGEMVTLTPCNASGQDVATLAFTPVVQTEKPGRGTTVGPNKVHRLTQQDEDHLHIHKIWADKSIKWYTLCSRTCVLFLGMSLVGMLLQDG